ncbi:hypothetical protein Tco_1067118 [Tanacetum coccineum]|uniref:Uncharacterized protein n=1 Tax=Tanacetum coccineum TaxID=301880 RepID=A0ABQ5HBZ7_9ASTR
MSYAVISYLLQRFGAEKALRRNVPQELHRDGDGEGLRFFLGGREVGRCIGEVVMSAVRGECGDVAVTRCFLSAVGEFFPKVDVEGSEKVVEVLLSGVEGGLRIGGGGGGFSPSNSAQSSPISGGGVTSSGNGIVEEMNSRVGGGGDKRGKAAEASGYIQFGVFDYTVINAELATCAQRDTLGKHQGAMYESVGSGELDISNTGVD